MMLLARLREAQAGNPDPRTPVPWDEQTGNGIDLVLLLKMPGSPQGHGVW